MSKKIKKEQTSLATELFVRFVTGCVAFVTLFSAIDYANYQSACDRAEKKESWRDELICNRKWTLLKAEPGVGDFVHMPGKWTTTWGETDKRTAFSPIYEKRDHFIPDFSENKCATLYLDGDGDECFDAVALIRNDGMDDRNFQNGHRISGELLKSRLIDTASRFYGGNPFFDRVPKAERRMLNQMAARKEQRSLRFMSIVLGLIAFVGACKMPGAIVDQSPKPKYRYVDKSGEYIG